MKKFWDEIWSSYLCTCGVDYHAQISHLFQTQQNVNMHTYQVTPFKLLPRFIIRELILEGRNFINDFGTKHGSSDSLLPRSIIENLPHADYNDLKFEFCQWSQLYVTEKDTNATLSYTIDTIALSIRQLQGNAMLFH